MPYDERNDIESIDITTIYSPTIFSDSINMITPSNLNPLAKNFIRGRVIGTVFQKLESTINTNAIGKSNDVSPFDLNFLFDVNSLLCNTVSSIVRSIIF